MDHQEWTLQCEDLSKEYQGGQAPCRAVREVNLTLHKGEFLMIMGKSGAGKSTLIRMMDGLLSPTKGRVLFDGENVFDFSEKKRSDFHGKKTGMVFQDSRLLEDFTLVENVALPGCLYQKEGSGIGESCKADRSCGARGAEGSPSLRGFCRTETKGGACKSNDESSGASVSG